MQRIFCAYWYLRTRLTQQLNTEHPIIIRYFSVSALLRMTDGSSTIYSPECGGWFLSNGTEVCGFATTSLLRTSVGIPGLAGIDRLLSFRIVHELRKFLKFYSESVKPFAVMLEQIRDGLFPEWKNTTDDGRLYNVAMKKTEEANVPASCLPQAHWAGPTPSQVDHQRIALQKQA